MKSTIDLDEEKLKRVMRLTGIKTRRKAIDFALTEAERIARIDSFYRLPFFVESQDDVIDPAYDLPGMRWRERPGER